MPQRLVTFEGKTQAFPADATDAEISAALNAIPSSNAAQVPKAKTWTDTAVEALPAAGALLGGALGAAGGPLGVAGGAALGGAGGEAWKQNINRLRGAEAPTSATDAASAIATEGATDAIIGGLGAGAAKAVGAVAGKGLRGAEKLFKILESQDWNKSLKAIVIPPLVKAGAKTAGALAGKGAQAMETRGASAAVADTLADETKLVVQSVEKGMDPATAIRIVADGSAEYADALRKAFGVYVKANGAPRVVPESVRKLMQSPSFAKLAKP